MNNQKVLILDFGGQYNQLIARRVRACQVYCEVHPWTMPLEKIRAYDPIGIIFTASTRSIRPMRIPASIPSASRSSESVTAASCWHRSWGAA